MTLSNAVRFSYCVIFAGLSLAACSPGALQGTAEARSSDPRPTLAAAPATTVAASPFERPLAIVPERAMTYAGLKFVVAKAVISNRTPDDTLPADAGPALADVTLKISNDSKDAVRVEGGRWELKLGDGTSYRQPYSDVVSARDTHERRITFPVPLAAQWTGASLMLDEKDKEPATLSLDGPPRPSSYPVKLATGGEGTTAGPAMTYTVMAANEDLDAPGERAPLGKRCLHLSVRVTDNEPETADQFLPEFFSLSIDGAPYKPEHMSDNNIISTHTSQEFTMSLLIPATAVKAELEVGKPGIQKTVRIPLSLKAVSAS